MTYYVFEKQLQQSYGLDIYRDLDSARLMRDALEARDLFRAHTTAWKIVAIVAGDIDACLTKFLQQEYTLIEEKQ